jgi:predicted ATPase
VGKSGIKRQHGRSSIRWENKIKMDIFKKSHGEAWIRLIRVRIRAGGVRL